MADHNIDASRFVISALLVVLGFLGGVGAMHLSIMTSVADNATSIAINGKSIEANTFAIDHNTALLEKALDLQKAMVQQNTLLIQEIVASKGKG